MSLKQGLAFEISRVIAGILLVIQKLFPIKQLKKYLPLRY